MDTNKLMPLLSDMAIFVTVIEQGNFSKAAKKLGVTPSAVSRQISRLEDALGIKLLERTTRQLALTESGNLTFDYCKQMVESAEHAVNASCSATSSVSGLLRVAVPRSLANKVLRPIFTEFLKRYPEIKLHLKVTDRILDPIHDGVDFLIHINDSPIEALVNVNIGYVKQVLCASPDFLEKHSLPAHPDELKHLPCICLGENVTDSRWRFSKKKQQLTVQVSGTYLLNHSDMRKDAIVQGFGIGPLPDYLAQQGIEKGTLIPLLQDWKMQGNYQGGICLQFVQSKYMPNKNRAFIDFMKQMSLMI
ncbi:LysR family transcriptional regulator [Pseudoalteromonas aurantia]|uniref:LysR family transcriptional regulator n=1 Tax=Pseudoalteromonas aurantia TaxID=43654 RepID=A0A5S3V0U9_9GAMM|nr:LysR family transcriptional regulator [Pseudoalteromonas aurantia]TMO64107.1 LysR family transcriptional regulator [Pseudoalteromonas aurantia]TMO69424.1 LysR family transcriptional regulator [Pseudoalteromonas aurantia]